MQNKPYVLWCCLLVVPVLLNAQFLVADINQSAVGSDPAFVRTGSSHFVFTALSSQYGRELFISDGTEAGTKLVRDFNPGTGSSQFWEVQIIDSLCYFIQAFDFDQLQYGVFKLQDPKPVVFKTLKAGVIVSGQNGEFTKLGAYVYFVHRSDNYRFQLWKTDGSTEGTTQVYEFGQNVFPDQFAVLNNQLIFLAEDKAGLKQLWKSDGSAQGTQLIKAVDNQYGIYSFTLFKQKVYFVANDGKSGWELWQSDGTTEGTQLFVDLEVGTGSSFPGSLTVVGNRLFFAASEADHGNELWVSEGTPQTTRLFKDIRLGKEGSLPYSITSFKNQFFFLADDGQYGTELWVSDGTAEGTRLLKDIFTGRGSAFRGVSLQGAANDDHFFFVATDSLQGKTLWRTDGTTGGTVLLQQIISGVGSNGNVELSSFKQNIYYKTHDGVHGLELWKSAGEAGKAEIFTELNPTSAGSSPNQIKVINNQLFFSGKTETLGYELWASDGTATGTRLVKDLNPGSESGDILLATPYKGQYVFAANHAQPRGRFLWKSDGTPEGTVVLKDNQGRGVSSTEYITVLKDKLIFNAYTPEFGEELWISDGSEMGTHILKDISPRGQSFPTLSSPPGILHDSLLFFTANEGIRGQQLWKTNGTSEGTLLVTNQGNIWQVGSVLGTFGDSLLLSVNNFLGDELWISDGSNEGTKLVKDIASGQAGSYPGSVVVIGKRFYFTADDLIHGRELWISDGTFNGTILLKDILPGDKSSFPNQLTQHQNELFFVVGQTNNGKDALWKTDGTAEGTIQVKQIASTNANSSIRNLFSWGAYLYFSADDGIHGHELWRSDGTEAGTTMLLDLNTGSASSDPEYFTPFKNDLYFSADDGVHGRELWRLLSDNVVSIDEPHMAEILVFPNPAIDQLIVRRNADNSNLIARLYDASGRTVVQPTLLSEESTELNVNTLPGGIYFLEVKAEGNLARRVKKIVIVR